MSRADEPRAPGTHAPDGAGVDGILGPLRPYLGAAARARRAELDIALVVVTADRDHERVEAALGADNPMRELPDGTRIAAAPRALVQRIADEETLQLAGELREQLAPGTTWCLVLTSRGAATRAITWPSMQATGAAS